MMERKRGTEREEGSKRERDGQKERDREREGQRERERQIEKGIERDRDGGKTHPPRLLHMSQLPLIECLLPEQCNMVNTSPPPAEMVFSSSPQPPCFQALWVSE